MSAMYLYSLTLQKATAITHAIYGNFSAPKAQEIVVAKGKVLELLRPTDSGKIQTVLSMDVFGIVRSLMPFRLTGDSRDYIVVGSDSGRIVILQYNPDKNAFDKIHQETFGKSGCRRIVPGQYLACDPKGRAVLIGAIEKQKLVYILNRDSSARLTISSPLEAHKSHTIVFSVTGVDVGFENPIFAAIELDYSDADQDSTGVAAANAQKHLTFYELDLGLNHVVRKWSEPIDKGANKLLTVPGGADGPGGVLICCENMVIWKNQGHEEVRAVLPRRKEWPKERSLLIVSAASHKQKDLFFFLLQSECGDLYKTTLKWKDDTVYEIQITYFDTVPVSNAMCVLKTGFLFVASEFSNHFLYQFQSIGEDTGEQDTDMSDEGYSSFSPRPLKNLVPIYEMESLSPIVDFKAVDLVKEDAKQLYMICGRGPRSSIRILRHGLAISEMAVSSLPGNPNSVWTVKKNKKDEYDRYIVVSFVNATLILSIGETVEEVTDSGFLGSTTTLNVGLIGDDSLVQIYPNGIRHIRSDRRITEWPTPGKKSIVHSAMNRKQVIIALSGGELLYFELDLTGQLVEVCRKEMGRDIACLGVAPIPKGRQRAKFLAVGDYDNTVRIVSLDSGDNFAPLAVLALPAPPESLCIIKMRGHSASDPSAATLYLNIGLQNGVLMRAVLDRISGELTDTRTRFLGSRPVRLFRTKVQGQPGVLALSSRPWLCYNFQQRFQLTPLSYVGLEYGSNFCSEQCPEGIVATTANTLRIITPERLGDVFNQEEIKLRYTPRKMLLHPTTNYIITLETDHNAYPATIYGGLRGKILEAQHSASSGSQSEVKQERMEDEHEGKEKHKDKGKEDPVKELERKQREQANREEYERTYGAPKPGEAKWASCLRIFDATTKETIDICELDNNEAALSACTCVFHDRGGEVFLVVGTAKDMHLHPRTDSGGFIHVYRLLDNGKRFSLLHKTPVESVPGALCGFQGRLLVGVGKVLRIYDLGRKKLLKKCENKAFPTMIRSITTQGDRIIIGDLAESFLYAKYRKAENLLAVFADDFLPRWITAHQVLDYDTLAGADKFGNVFFLRVPAEANDEIDDPAGPMFGRGYLNGAPYKLNSIANVHIGELVNSMSKTTLVTGGAEALIYTTIMGGIGAILPFMSREDIDFFSHLEMHMRNEMPPLCGREHLSFRSYYYPVKDVIDGDLCEQYAMLPPDKQKSIADELDRTPSEVLKKLEVIRNSLL